MLVTLDRRHHLLLCLLTVFLLAITAFSIILSDKIFNEEGEKLFLETNSPNNLDELLQQFSLKKIIKSLSTNKAMGLVKNKTIENKGHKMESLIDVGESQNQRNLKSVLSECPIKSPHLLGSLFVNEVSNQLKLHQ